MTGLKRIDYLVYLDDLVSYSTTIDEYVRKLRRIFEQLEQARFKIQLDKCDFVIDSVEYLGHIVTKHGDKPDSKKIRAVCEYPVPRTVKDIRYFIGLASYYRRHVPNFAEIAKSLTSFTKKYVPFEWTGRQQAAFGSLKELLSTEPLLIYSDFSQPLILACDASTKAIGAVLSQLRNGEEKPIAYCSRQLNPAETRYSIKELEFSL